MRRILALLCSAVFVVGCGGGERLGGIEQDPAHSGPAPELPLFFDDWGIYQRMDRNSIYYATEDITQGVYVSVYAPGEFDGRLEQLDSAQAVDNWWCGSIDEITSECFTLAWDKEVNLSSEQLIPEELAAFGDQLLTAWSQP